MIIILLMFWEGAEVDGCSLQKRGRNTISPSQDTLTPKLCLREAKGTQKITASKILSRNI